MIEKQRNLSKIGIVEEGASFTVLIVTKTHSLLRFWF